MGRRGERVVMILGLADWGGETDLSSEVYGAVANQRVGECFRRPKELHDINRSAQSPNQLWPLISNGTKLGG